MEKIISILSKISLFKGLDKKNLIHICKICKIKKFKKNKIIFTENSIGKTLFVVFSGVVKIYGEHKKKKKIFTYLDKGEFFGDLTLLGERTRSATAQALTDSEVLVIYHNDFIKILKKYPNISINMLKVLIKRLKLADKEIENLAFYNVLPRISKVLVNFDKKYGKNTLKGRLIDFKLSFSDLAALIGTVREVAVRAIRQLERLHYLKYLRSKKILVLNEDKLKEISMR